MIKENIEFGNNKLKDKLLGFRDDIYGFSDKKDDRLYNISDEWVSFLKSDKKMSKNSFIKLNIGNRGGGKTGSVFCETNILLENPKRVVQFWKTDAIIEKINAYCPKELVGRYESINNLSEIKPNSIFVIDEGIIGANAKEALKKEMRNLIKFLSKSRHYNIIAIINSVSLGVLLQFRNMIDIVSYRRLPRSFLVNNTSKDYILKVYTDELVKLKEWESIFISSYKLFQKEGFISMKLENFCPWFNDKISMYQQSTSADVSLDENKQMLENHKEIVEWIICEVKTKFVGKGGFDDFSMWLYKDHNETYHNNNSQLKTIYKLYLHYIKEKIINYEEIERNNVFDELFGSKFVWEFSDEDVFDVIRKEKKSVREIERNIEMYKYRKKTGITYTDLGFEFGVCDQTANTACKKLDDWFHYYKGKLFEKKYYNYLSTLRKKKVFDRVELIGEVGKPDIIATKGEEIYIFSLKCFSVKFPHFISRVDIMPEYKYAYESKFSYNYTNLFAIIFDSNTNKLFEFELDVDRPSNIIINE